MCPFQGDFLKVYNVLDCRQLRECVTQFGTQVEAILSKYGRNILRECTVNHHMCVYVYMIDEQFILRRLSEAAIDTYAMAVTLSR